MAPSLPFRDQARFAAVARARRGQCLASFRPMAALQPMSGVRLPAALSRRRSDANTDRAIRSDWDAPNVP